VNYIKVNRVTFRVFGETSNTATTYERYMKTDDMQR